MDTENKIKTDDLKSDLQNDNNQNQMPNQVQNDEVSSYQKASTIPSQKQAMTGEEMGSIINTRENETENMDNNGNVILSPAQNRIPLWFILVFVFTIVLFVIITALLIMRIQKDKNIPGVKKPAVNPSQAVKPTEVSAPTIASNPTEANDKETEDLMNISPGDNLDDIENDINNTKLNILDDFINNEKTIESSPSSKP